MGAVLAGSANVIMQLSWPSIGYAVKESKVHSGSAVEHPVKRARTTFTYLAVALLGDDRDRRVFGQAVNHQHAQVRSDASSPVEYNAMDPQLQLWVAACLYYGAVDLHERMYGALAPADADALYAYCARLGTTLQVRRDMWPADRDAFAEYWRQGVARAQIDETIRDYLDRLTTLENLPKVVQRAAGDANLFWTRGFLPPEFRAMMGYRWSDREEAVFTRRLRRLGSVQRRLPASAGSFPFDALLWDMRRRHRAGAPLV